jgi:hypothetical protein
MPTTGDPVALLARTLEQADAVVGRVRPEQATLPTPCRSWDVRALVNHLVQDVRQFTVMANGGRWESSDADVRGRAVRAGLGGGRTSSPSSAATRRAGRSSVPRWRRPTTRRCTTGSRPGSGATSADRPCQVTGTVSGTPNLRQYCLPASGRVRIGS